ASLFYHIFRADSSTTNRLLVGQSPGLIQLLYAHLLITFLKQVPTEEVMRPNARSNALGGSQLSYGFSKSSFCRRILEVDLLQYPSQHHLSLCSSKNIAQFSRMECLLRVIERLFKIAS